MGFLGMDASPSTVRMIVMMMISWVAARDWVDVLDEHLAHTLTGTALSY